MFAFFPTAAFVAAPSSLPAHQAIEIVVQLPPDGLKPGRSEIVVRLSIDGKPLSVAPKASLTMPAMAMMTVASPTVSPGKTPGEYRLSLAFPHGGRYRLTVRAEVPGKPFVEKEFPLDVGSGEMAMDMDAMRGVLGPWSMAREGSGTSWLPDESPMFMKILPKTGRYSLSYMGNLSLNDTDSNVGGKRGPHEFYSNSMPMLMARRSLSNGGVLGLRVMGSLDPIFNGQFGAPNLFQTGETAHGRELVDRQHPHDLVAEASATYSHPLGGESRAFVYLAPIGEPALAGSMYLMRPSGMENPEAPISHHWFDSSHITFGVVTAGVTVGDRWKIDGSLFNGHEPDENRYVPDNLRLDSASGRLTYSPTKSLSASVSHAYLRSPESQSPGSDENRTTAALSYGRQLRGGDWLAATAYWGRNAHGGHFSDAYLAEASLYRGDWSAYARYENVAKDELAGVPAGTYKVQKLTFGATRDFAHRGGFDFGFGAYAGLYGVPAGLRDAYGEFPVTAGVYVRIRPGRMSHDMAHMTKGDMPGMKMR